MIKILLLLAGLSWWAAFSVPSSRLNLVFCDVGQGDAILISRGLTQILIDGGPNDKVLECLSNNLPFFDRKLEIVILTHPDADHLTGIIPVMDKYEVEYFFSGPERSSSSAYDSLLSRIETKKIKVVNPFAGTKIRMGKLELESLWPRKAWLAERVDLGDKKVLGAKTSHQNLNDFSLVFLMRYKDLEVLLMGDADWGIQNKMQDDRMIMNSQKGIDILKFPHHGSKTGMSAEFLAKTKPKEAVISVGKNSFGHPTNEALDLLKEYKVKTRRTDVEGEIRYNF